MAISKKIYRHSISVTLGSQKISMPEGTEIMSTEWDGVRLHMYVVAPPYMLPKDNPPMEAREFFFVATGDEFTIDEGDKIVFITTIPIFERSLHLFELQTIKK